MLRQVHCRSLAAEAARLQDARRGGEAAVPQPEQRGQQRGQARGPPGDG